MTSPYVKGGINGALIIAALSGAAWYFDPQIPTITMPSLPTSWTEVKEMTKEKPLPPQAGCDDQVTLRVVKSLREEPGDWKLDDFRIERGGWTSSGPDLKIWIANEDYGLDFITDGGISSDDAKYPFTEACRAYLYATTNEFRVIQYNAEQAAKAAAAAEEQAELESATKGL